MGVRSESENKKNGKTCYVMLRLDVTVYIESQKGKLLFKNIWNDERNVFTKINIELKWVCQRKNIFYWILIIFKHIYMTGDKEEYI